MRWGRVALAVVFLAWAGGAIASPLIATVNGVSLTSHREVETVRWRHRHHRSSSWGERGEADRGASGDSARGLAQEDISPPEIVRPDLGRRSYRGRSWSGRRGAPRDEPGDFALSVSGANRLTPSEVGRPDARRRRGWVDPPPPQ
jgi:hypothetical protein